MKFYKISIILLFLLLFFVGAVGASDVKGGNELKEATNTIIQECEFINSTSFKNSGAVYSCYDNK